jgi:hypothetical protein
VVDGVNVKPGWMCWMYTWSALPAWSLQGRGTFMCLPSGLVVACVAIIALYTYASVS